MLDLPKIKKEVEGNISEVRKIKKVLIGIAMAVGLTTMGAPAFATQDEAPTIPAAVQQDQQNQQQDTQNTLLLTPASDNAVTVAQHWSHRSHSSHQSHYSSRY